MLLVTLVIHLSHPMVDTLATSASKVRLQRSGFTTSLHKNPAGLTPLKVNYLATTPSVHPSYPPMDNILHSALREFVLSSLIFMIIRIKRCAPLAHDKYQAIRMDLQRRSQSRQMGDGQRTSLKQASRYLTASPGRLA